jgi:hypothetical protein
MSGNQVPAPRLPTPSSEYSVDYMSDLVRSLEAFINQERNPGAIRGTTLTLTDLPTSPTGLETGTLYNDAGTVKVA